MIRHLRRDARGTTIVEFGVLAPVMITLIMGAIEMGHFLSVRSTLEGAVVEAARQATASMEIDEDDRDQAMRDLITKHMSAFPIAEGHQLVIATKAYRDFGTAYPEEFTDTNGNGVYDPGEAFIDRNGNGHWDPDLPISGTDLGSPGDVVSYTAIFVTDPYFQMIGRIMGLEGGLTLTATTVVRNEPVKKKTT